MGRTPREKRWVVRARDGETVGEIVLRAGEGLGVIAEGRVFVGRRRVRGEGERVRVGDEVRIGAGAEGTDPTAGSEVRSAVPVSSSGSAVRDPVPRSRSEAALRGAVSGDVSEVAGEGWRVLWERGGLLACFKPAGMPTVPDHGGAAHSLVGVVAVRCGSRVAQLFVTSRLDREVSGVVVLATTREAEARLRDARERGVYARRYVAIARDTPGLHAATLINVDGIDQPLSSVRVWDAPIGRGKDARHRAVRGSEAKEAATRWKVVGRAGGFVMLAVEPQTGRTHQIRVHAADAGAPLLGDRDYGGSVRVSLPGGRVMALPRIALHAARVTVPDEHDVTLVALAPVPAPLLRAWSDLGGEPEAWDTALSCVFEP